MYKEILSSIEDAYLKGVAAAGSERYKFFQEVADHCDALLWKTVYKNQPENLRPIVAEYKLSFGNLFHNAVGSCCSASGFQKALDENRVFSHHKTKIPHTVEYMKEVVTRNDKVIVENYATMIQLFRELIQYFE